MDGRLLAVVIVAVALVARASAGPDDPDKTLTARDVQKYFEPYVPEVRSCYLNHARGKNLTGELRLELIIHRNGSIYRFGFVAPGVDKPAHRRLDACLRALVPTWRFPVRTGFTTAVVPFLFHKAKAPGSGPIESCWDARGCPPGTAKGSK